MYGSIDMRVLLIGAIALIMAFQQTPAGGGANASLACAPTFARMAGDITGSIAPAPAAPVATCR